MERFSVGMDLRQNPRFIRPWISRSFCICVTAWVCLFLPFDMLSKPTRLLNSHWGALTEAGTFFPEKKKNSYTKFLHRNRNILIPSYVYPTGTVMGENIPVDIQVGRNYKNFQLKRQFPSCSIISLLLLKKDTHSFGMSRIWKQLWFFFFFFKWEILRC